MVIFAVLSIILFIINIKLKKIENYKDSYKKTSSDVTSKTYKIFRYSDILAEIFDSNDNFQLIKIDKDISNKNFISMELRYNGNLDNLVKGINDLKKRNMIKEIQRINIVKNDENQYSAEINVDFFKYKQN